MVEFKVIKYKHFRQASAIKNNPQSTDEEYVSYIMAMVDSWDLIDIETGEPIPPGVYDELTREQFEEVVSRFNGRFTEDSKIPNGNG